MDIEQGPWARSQNGVLFGVCRGLADKFDISPVLVRLALVFSVLFFGTGLLVYILLAIALPREDRIHKAYEKKILGVCLRVSQKVEIEVGLVRFLTLLVLFFTGGVTVLFYVLLHFMLDSNEVKTVNKRQG